MVRGRNNPSTLQIITYVGILQKMYNTDFNNRIDKRGVCYCANANICEEWWQSVNNGTESACTHGGEGIEHREYATDPSGCARTA